MTWHFRISAATRQHGVVMTGSGGDCGQWRAGSAGRWQAGSAERWQLWQWRAVVSPASGGGGGGGDGMVAAETERCMPVRDSAVGVGRILGEEHCVYRDTGRCRTVGGSPGSREGRWDSSDLITV